MKMPNLFLIGAMKSGTTTVHRMLDSHPDVFMCPVKEPHHFDLDIDPERFVDPWRWDPRPYRRFLAGSGDPPHVAYVRDPDEYGRLFADAGTARWRGESTVSYLYSTRAAGEITASSPGARFIVVLREPSMRAASHVASEMSQGREDAPDPITAVHRDLAREPVWGRSHLYVPLGGYAAQLTRLFAVVDPGRVLVLFHAHLASDPAGVAASLARHLDVDLAGFAPAGHANPTREPRFARLNTVMFHSGVQRTLRRWTPRPVRRALSPLWFRGERRAPSPSPGWLSEHFAGEAERVAAITGLAVPWEAGGGT